MSLTTNYFELFNLPIDFEVDLRALSGRYHKLQQAVHPDNYASAPERERRLAVQKAAQINEAFQTLKNPLKRAHYFLELHHTLPESANQHILDNAFLMQQMELRETLAEINDTESLNDFLAQLTQSQQNIMTTLSQQFEAQNYESAYYSINKLHFFEKLYEEAMNVEEKL